MKLFLKISWLLTLNYLYVSLPINPIKNVYFQIKDSSEFPSFDKSQFFESFTQSKTLKFSYDRIPQHKFTFSSLKHYLSNNKLIKKCNRKDSLIHSIKSYWRSEGFFPIDELKEEIRKANRDIFYTPNIDNTRKILGNLFRPKNYIAYKNIKNMYELKHELLGLCSSCKDFKGKISFHHYIIDRDANLEYPEVWNTKIRLIYIGEGDNCDKDDRFWVENRSVHLNLKDETYGLGKLKYSINNVLKDIRIYLRVFPKFNMLYNCQHFANNLYNKIARKNEELISKDVMTIKEKNGSSNEMKLLYNFQ